MQAVVPELGHVIRAARTPFLQEFGLYAGIGGVLLLGMGQIWGKDDDDSDDNDDSEDVQ